MKDNSPNNTPKPRSIEVATLPSSTKIGGATVPGITKIDPSKGSGTDKKK
jgi:hypothetical protein